MIFDRVRRLEAEMVILRAFTEHELRITAENRFRRLEAKIANLNRRLRDLEQQQDAK